MGENKTMLITFPIHRKELNRIIKQNSFNYCVFIEKEFSFEILLERKETDSFFFQVQYLDNSKVKNYFYGTPPEFSDSKFSFENNVEYCFMTFVKVFREYTDNYSKFSSKNKTNILNHIIYALENSDVENFVIFFEYSEDKGIYVAEIFENFIDCNSIIFYDGDNQEFESKDELKEKLK